MYVRAKECFEDIIILLIPLYFSEIAFPAIIKFYGTLIFLMGVTEGGRCRSRDGGEGDKAKFLGWKGLYILSYIYTTTGAE